MNLFGEPPTHLVFKTMMADITNATGSGGGGAAAAGSKIFIYKWIITKKKNDSKYCEKSGSITKNYVGERF